MRALSGWITVLAAALPAVSTADTHPLIDSEFYFLGGDFFAKESLKLRVDGTIGPPELGIDVNKSLKDDYNDQVISLEGRWRFGERWLAAMQYFEVTDSASALLEDDIDWGDLQFQAGVLVSSSSRIGITRLYFGREFRRTDTRTFGIGGGLHQIEISASVTGEAFVDGASIGERRGVATASGPLPNLGMWYTWAPTEKWALTSRLDWLSASVPPYDGTIVNASFGVNYAAGRHWGMGLNYNLFHLDASVDDAAWSGKVELRYHGPYAYLSVYW